MDFGIKWEYNLYCHNVKVYKTMDWGLNDPTGKIDQEFIETIRIIETKIRDLANELNR